MTDLLPHEVKNMRSRADENEAETQKEEPLLSGSG